MSLTNLGTNVTLRKLCYDLCHIFHKDFYFIVVDKRGKQAS